MASDTFQIVPEQEAVAWPEVKAAFLSSPSMTITALSRDYDIPSSTISKRSLHEGWERERDRIFSRAATREAERAARDRVKELSNLNHADLVLARAMRAQIGAIIKVAQDTNRPIKPQDIRSLASAHESCQRVARLALGAETMNVNHKTDAEFTTVNPGLLSDDAMREFLEAVDRDAIEADAS